MKETRGELIQKLDAFIRKYYKNRLIRGGIYTFTIILSYYIFVALLEYFGHFGTMVRGILFWSFAILTFFSAGFYIMLPLLALRRIGKVISYEEAAKVIGAHFPSIEDKLLNTLQLQEQAAQSDNELLMASIEQRTLQLRPVAFTAAINLKKNLRYLRYAAIPAAVILLVLIVAPGMITDPGTRIFQYNRHFERKAPFNFIIRNSSLKAEQNADYELLMKTSGQQLPDEVYMLINGKTFRMEKKSKNEFVYTFRNLQKSLEFNFLADDYNSDPYQLEVIPQPRVMGFDISLHYPAYIGKPDEKLHNTGDLTIPAGTEVSWKFSTSSVKQLALFFNGKEVSKSKRDDNEYIFSSRFLKSINYSVKPSNDYINGRDSLNFSVQVIPDAHPSIETTEQQDSLNSKVKYFSGDVSDDYGITKLSFHCRYVKSDNKTKLNRPAIQVPLKIERAKLQQAFYYFADFSLYQIEPGDELEYYFEVWDNDGVNGSKSARSVPHIYKAPGKEELAKMKEDDSKEIKKDVNEAIKEAKNIQKDIKKLSDKLAEKKQLSFDDKKQVEELMKRQEQLQNRIDEIKKEHQESIRKQEEFSEPNNEILQKQQELQQLMNKMFDDEMKELMKQFEDLLRQNDKDVLKEQLDKMQVEDKEVQKELDRMLEMYKKLEIEEKKQDVVDKLDQLQKDQEKLSEENQEKKGSVEEQKKKQEELNQKFEDIKKQIDDIEKKNEELEKPDPMEDTKQEEQEIDKQQQESKEQMNKGNRKQASQNQKKAADKMKEMKKKIEKDMQKQQQQSLEEDYNNLRQILENLVKLSFDQEAVMEELRGVNGYNPQYVKIGQKQKMLRDDARLIEDSLQSLSKRQIRIQPVINKEITQINLNMDKALAELSDRNIYQARSRQQFVMTHVNNLAVMLSESLKSMQDAMKENKPGSGQCGNPGGKKPKSGKNGNSGKDGQKNGGSEGLKSLRQMQEQLAKQIEEMKKGMQPGQNGKPGQNGMPSSQQLAQAAAQQAAIRQKLRQLSQQFGKEGNTKLMKELEEIQRMMDQNEQDLYNRKVTPEMMKRQQDIQFKLLESEKARQEQETDNERKANSGNDKPGDAPKRFEAYKKQQEAGKEMLQTIPPGFNPYYKEKVKQYFEKPGKK